MSDVSLEVLLRLESGELAAAEAEALRARLEDDAEASEWLSWIVALRATAVACTPTDERVGPAPDPMDVAELAEGLLSQDDELRVRRELAHCADGYGQLEAAVHEMRHEWGAPLPAPLPGPLPSTPPVPASDGLAGKRTKPWWQRPVTWCALAAAAVLGVVLQIAPGSDDARLRALAVREPMSVPELRTTNVKLGLTAYREGDFSVARAEFTRALEQEPGNGPAWLYMGSARLLQGADAAAVDALDRARTLCRDSYAIEATWQLSQALLATGETERAQALLGELAGTRRSGDAAALLRAIAGDLP